jgi:8-oxo-dGTP pyrophosphatase MutT (NUDIX family)
MRRAERKGDPWSGHLAFPGGREEPEDPDLLAVSIRETWEEVGVDLREAELLGQLDDMSSRPARSMLVRPFVFALHREPVFRTNEEVASMHSTTLDRLLANEGRGTMRWPHHTVGMRLPRVDFDGQRLWGMTLRMVDDLLHRVDGGGMDLDRLPSS